jgi:hypothetical protein
MACDERDRPFEDVRARDDHSPELDNKARSPANNRTIGTSATKPYASPGRALLSIVTWANRSAPMAAINVIRQRQAVHILSDGVFCDATGIVCEIGPNAFALPHLPAAMAIRGSSHLMPFLVHRLSRECRSFDDMLVRLVQAAQEVHASFPMAFGTLGYGSLEPDFDLVVVGWSKSNGETASYLVSSQDRVVAHGVTAKAWQLAELPEVLIAPPIAEKQIAAVGWSVPHSAESFRPDVDGVALLKSQRSSRRQLDARSGMRGHVYVVGGFIQLTSVSSHGVSSDVLHWWPDKVGRRIEP